MNKLFQKPRKKSEIIRGAIADICKEDKVKLTAKTPKKYAVDAIADRVLNKMYGEETIVSDATKHDVKECIYNDADYLKKTFNINVVEG